MKNIKKQHRALRKLIEEKTGLTLVELMMIVAIIGTLVAIAVPIYNSNTEAAKITTDQANLRILNSATMQYRINENIIGDYVFAGTNDNQGHMQLQFSCSLISIFSRAKIFFNRGLLGGIIGLY